LIALHRWLVVPGYDYLVDAAVPLELNEAVMNMSEEDRCFLLENGKLRRYRRGHHLFKQGDEGTCLFLVLAGEVETFVEDSNRRTVIARAGAGHLFGCLALLSGRGQSASAVTIRDTLLAIISKSAFEQRINARPEFFAAILCDLAATIGELTLRLSTLPLDAYGRLRFCLQSLARNTNCVPVVIEGSWTQRQLSELIGCRRETVAKMMSTLKRGHWIRCDETRITILRPLPEVF
jgi:CRP/FNR family cyclic AMP-dependent transcriptional regulator